MAGRIAHVEIAHTVEGHSKGWAKVEFEAFDGAQNAIHIFDGSEFQGRILKVRWDRSQQVQQLLFPILS